MSPLGYIATSALVLLALATAYWLAARSGPPGTSRRRTSPVTTAAALAAVVAPAWALDRAGGLKVAADAPLTGALVFGLIVALQVAAVIALAVVGARGRGARS